MDRQEIPHLDEPEKGRRALDLCLRSTDVPYVFDSRLDSWNKFRAYIASELGLGQEDIAVVVADVLVQPKTAQQLEALF